VQVLFGYMFVARACVVMREFMLSVTYPAYVSLVLVMLVIITLFALLALLGYREGDGPPYRPSLNFLLARPTMVWLVNR
jgi:hypothetical protein